MKRMTNRLWIAALCCLLIATLAGCGGHGGAAATDAPSGGSDAKASPSPSPTKAPTLPPSPTPSPLPAPTSKGSVKDGWVTSIPESVPRFRHGRLDMENSTITEAGISTLYDLQFTGVEKADVDEYCKVLRAAGYDAATIEINNSYTMTAAKDLGWNSIALVITLDETTGVAIYALDAPV